MDTILKISDAANLAIHAMVYVARSKPGMNHSVSKIAAAQGGSESHLSKVLQRLVKSGLLASRRGPSGGFILGREANRIALIEILEAIDGPLLDCKCVLGRQKCMFGSCALGALISHVNGQMRSFLATRKLADMVDKTTKRRSGAPRLQRCHDRPVRPPKNSVRGAVRDKSRPAKTTRPRTGLTRLEETGLFRRE